MSIKVFLADDHTVVRDGLNALLDTQADLTVIGAAADGRETVRQVGDLQPDVVVMDITMPELNGIEATYQIRQNWPQTRVIILSMHASTEHIVRALQAGACGYLLKDSAGMEVAKAVRSVVTGRRYLSQKISDKVIDEYVRQYDGRIVTNPLDRLSPRERETLQLVVEGKSSAEIAEILFLSPKTIETYRCRLMQKLGINDIPSLVKFAIQQGLTPAD
jgi:DNA-binding NarL/FixJ family response regulator